MLDNELFKEINEYCFEKHDGWIYHYTKPICFCGIIKNNCFRFKEITNFDDNQEFYNTLDVFREVLNETPDEDNYKKFKEIYLNYDLKEIIAPKAVLNSENSIIYKYYVACFSTYYDDEYMWTKYAKDSDNNNGYCLRFSKELFEDTSNEYNEDYTTFFYNCKVSYDRYKLRNILKSFLNDYIEHYSEENILEFYDILRYLAIFNKRKSPFINEQEYRYVIVRTFDSKKQEKIGTYENFNENTLTPYIESKFYKTALHLVCCSPFIKNKTQQCNVIEFLNKYGYPTNNKNENSIIVECSRINI